MNKTISFRSVLAEQMQQFVDFKRMEGYDYSDQVCKLSYFDNFLFEKYDGVQQPCLNLDMLQAFIATTAHLEGYTRCDKLSALREFSRYLHARNPISVILPRDIVPICKSTLRFYRITPEQVADLMKATLMIMPPESIRTHAIRMLIGLLYCTGLRIREALNLTIGDIDMKDSMLHVTKGKFAKQRLVPMSPSTLAALRKYLAFRESHASTTRSSSLFIGSYNKALSRQQAYRGFCRLCQHCGLDGKPLPRFHDLRHNYACQRLTLWREEGKDVNAMLPVLATAMGHAKFLYTQTYFHIELGDLRWAATRLSAHFNNHLEKKQ